MKFKYLFKIQVYLLWYSIVWKTNLHIGMQLQWWQYFNDKIDVVAERLDLWGFFCVKKKQQTLA